MDNKFCNADFNSTGLIEIINCFYPIGIETITDIYQQFSNQFDDEPKGNDLNFRKDEDKSELKGLKQKFYISDEAKYIGIDFPTWINFGGNRKRIMIVGIDPLRGWEETKDIIEIGTPYGFHDRNIRKKMILYWNFINALSVNSSVYLTDTFKVFYYLNGIKNDKSRSSSDKKFTHPHEHKKHQYDDIHQIIFEKEHAIIKPDLIVTLGHIPRIWFSQEQGSMSFDKIKQAASCNQLKLKYKDTPILPLPHLSGRSVISAKKFINANNLNEIPQLYVNFVEDFFG